MEPKLRYFIDKNKNKKKHSKKNTKNETPTRPTGLLEYKSISPYMEEYKSIYIDIDCHSSSELKKICISLLLLCLPPFVTFLVSIYPPSCGLSVGCYEFVLALFHMYPGIFLRGLSLMVRWTLAHRETLAVQTAGHWGAAECISISRVTICDLSYRKGYAVLSYALPLPRSVAPHGPFDLKLPCCIKSQEHLQAETSYVLYALETSFGCCLYCVDTYPSVTLYCRRRVSPAGNRRSNSLPCSRVPRPT